MKNIVNNHKSIILLNGTPPNKLLTSFLATNVPIIAADGACAKAHNLNLAPDYIVGDGDSSSLSPAHAQVISVSDQNTTDFEKCISFAKKENLLPSLVLGISGGEIDHTLGNVQALAKHSSNMSLYFLDTYQHHDRTLLGIKLGIVLEPGKTTLELPIGNLLSLIPVEPTTLTTSGLTWELDNAELNCRSILGVRNNIANSLVSVTITTGKMIMIIDISKNSP